MFKLKILLLGPCASGKTTIANFLSDATENSSGEYRPTQGVRILEFEMQNLNVNNEKLKAEIELWDCSGDHKFEACWPALQRDTHGIIFIYNPSSAHHARDLELLYNYFVTQTGFSHKNCVVFANQMRPADKDLKLSSKMLNISSWVLQVPVSVEESGNRLQADFSSFIASVLGRLRDHSEQEELNIINMQSA
ncbi:intraflagellar transport protein 22 homolog isoform X2 [Zootermopsis nevadensis]|uniref:Rab-like protein 5 n=1 Tax=Zootermopsis nevadensis TaxID=136037 RepID=A0A067R4E3_ZOONE|nr:intraflagellar transport protein 22 homolog isoform X2 [Zootermopsis nevadensis]KDR18061.1 Rab-like protein 5 [Zootermopsis nevadensis]